MVDVEDAEGQSPKDSSKGSAPSKRRSRKESRPRPEYDDAVMVDADQGPSGPDDGVLVDTPRDPRDRRLKRANTAPPKKQESGGLMGLFGSLRKNTRPEMPDRRKSRSYRDDEYRYMTEPERDDPRRAARRDDRDRRRRSVRPDTDAEGFATDFAGAAAFEIEPEDAEARRAARRAKRSSRQAPSDTRDFEEVREAEERRARRREKERAREQRDRELAEEEERRRIRRAAREERRAREEQAAREAEAAAEAEARAAERRERRRLRDLRDEEMAAQARRRRSRAEEPVNLYPDERRRGSRTDDSKTRRRPRPIIDEYPEPAMTGGLLGRPKDKTSSWVYSQADEPPEPPQLVPTFIDMPPAAAAAAAEGLNAHSLSSDEEARRAVRRRARRRAKYGDIPDEEIDDTRSRRRESRRDPKSSSGSGDYERDRGMRSRGSRQDAPPSSGTKKSSWLRKLANF
ncbi:uncharacterized protein N7483_011301 [Penicillium malachiteum]|uniref:uncharacterized protein n=1 Tax=Penicillium malachiteum TaxID=1324776 RepID=UPI0025488B10|nr:uncharacterized protein N7483_011301 [Penicillium malachiteum]KAJ5714120.1 hypothetical protein N7483_011301 [Penicillium malachiteum]